MPRTVKIVGSIVITAFGLIWMALNVIGTAATVIDLLDWVPMWIRKLAAHEEIAYQVGPWFLMGLGIISLLALHFWPVRTGSKTATLKKPRRLQTNQGVPKLNPQALRIGHELAKAEEEIKRQCDAAIRGDDLKEEAADEFVPMPEATRRAYEQLRAIGSIWAGAADRLAARPTGMAREEAALVYMAGALKTQHVPMYGAHPPSRIRELIDPAEFNRGSFGDSGATFSYYMEKEPKYVDVAVRERDLIAAIAKMKRDSRREELKGEAAFQRGFDPNSAGTRDAALLLLTQLRSEGVEIRNDIPDFLTTADLTEWVHEVAEWMREVIDALRPISAADAEWFMTLDAVPAARVPIPNIRLGGKEERELFVSTFRQHDYRLKRLEDLLKKHGVGGG